MYDELGHGAWSYIPSLIISAIITAGVYSAFPLIYAWLRRRRVTKKGYRIVCYCVNFAVTLLLSMVNILVSNEQDGTAGVWAYVFWTGIFTVPGAKILRRRGALEGSVATPDESDSEYEPAAYERYAGEGRRRTLRFCTRCGFKLEENSRFCSRCGTSRDDM